MPRSEDPLAGFGPPAPDATPDPAPAAPGVAPATTETTSEARVGLRVTTPFLDFFQVTLGEGEQAATYTIARHVTAVPAGAADEIVKRAEGLDVTIEKVNA